MKYYYDRCLAANIPEFIEMVKEGHMLAIPNDISHFKNLFEELEKRQDEHDNIKYEYISLLFTRNEEKAHKMLKELVEREHEPSMYIYGVMLLKGEKVEVNEKMGIELIERSANKNYALSLYEKSLALFYGNYGYKKDLEKSLEYALKAIDQGYELGNFLTGRIYTNMEPCLENMLKAIEYFEKIDKEEAADVMLKQLGYAYERLGKSYIHGRHGIKVDVVIGNEYLDKAAALYEYMKNR